MDLKSIEAEINKNKIRQGILKKQSKFLKEWRDRWVVLTSNFLFTFTNEKMQEITHVLELKQIEGIKSYLKNTDDITNNGFKVQSSDNVLILMAKDLDQKWSWIVCLERLVDFRFIKATKSCKSIEDVRNAGFPSLTDYQMKHGQKEKINKQEQTKDNAEKIQNQQQSQQKPKEQQHLNETKQQSQQSSNIDDISNMIKQLKLQQQKGNALQQNIISDLMQLGGEVEGKHKQKLEEIEMKMKEYFNLHANSQREYTIKGMQIASKIGGNKQELDKAVVQLREAKSLS